MGTREKIRQAADIDMDATIFSQKRFYKIFDGFSAKLE
jgi:hypothetical protein